LLLRKWEKCIWGCKIDKDAKEEIIEVTRRIYPRAKLFQGEKHSREFELVFREIT
jgi:hypothetical protein